MADDRATWIRHARSLTFLAAAVHGLQFIAGIGLWAVTGSPVLAAFGIDAIVSQINSLLLALQIVPPDVLPEQPSRFVRMTGYGYVAGAVVAAFLGGAHLWFGRTSTPHISGIALAAVSMLAIPIIGSYMKSLAVELRSNVLKSASIFTFGNSYLSLVLLVSLLMRGPMDVRWADAVGALAMVPFIAQKGIQIIEDEGRREYVED